MSRAVLRRVLSLPTAPFAEHHVSAFVEQFCAKRPGVQLTQDGVGNLLAHVRKGRRVARPVCVTAHLDHPGFVADCMTGKARLRAFWRGGVPAEYFPKARVRFYVDGEWIKGQVQSVKTERQQGVTRVTTANLAVAQAVPPGALGMWDLPAPVVRGRKIYAPACDDLAGVAALLSALDVLARGAESADAYFLFTRAEEVGFVGALGAARADIIPASCFVLAMDTSAQRPFAPQGEGVILRIGDKTSAFTPAVSAHCHQVAQEIAKQDKRFRFQRKLMDGGTCEASAYCALGYEATGVCLSLGNYHNVDTKRKRLAPEYIDLRDYDTAIKLFVGLARTALRYKGHDDQLAGKLKEIMARYRKLLRDTVDGPA